MLKINGILSTASAYAVVFDATYETPCGKVPVVLKQVVMRTGLHNTPEGFRFEGRAFTREDARKVFEQEHKLLWFKKRRSYLLEKFNKEVENCQYLARYGLAPVVHHSAVKHEGRIHFGYIVMSRCDGTLKDVLARRDLHSDELKKVQAAVDRLYDLGLAHTDLKPSNMGVFYDRHKNVSRVVFIDCQVVPCVNDRKARKKHIDRFNRKAAANMGLSWDSHRVLIK